MTRIIAAVRRGGDSLEFHDPGAVAEFIDIDKGKQKQDKMQVGNGCLARKADADMTVALDGARAAAGDDQRHRIVIVDIAVGHAAAA